MKGRKKVLISDIDIARNTLFDTMYEKMNVISQQIESSYFETVEQGHRMKKMSKGCIILETVINQVPYEVVVELTEDEKYERPRVKGFLKSLKIVNKQFQKEIIDSPWILSQLLNERRFDDEFDYSGRIYKNKINYIKGIEEIKQEKKVVNQEVDFYSELEQLEEIYS